MTAAEMLDLKAAAARLGIGYGSIRRYRSQDDTFPTPDAMRGQIPLWLPATIDAWQAARPGKGAGAGRPPKGSPDPDAPLHPYFLAKAREVLHRAGGDPDTAGALARWAQLHRPAGETHFGVLVALDGSLVAETERTDYDAVRGLGQAGSRWLIGPEDAERLGSRRRDVRDAMWPVSQVIGQPLIHVTYLDVCEGAGKYIKQV